MKDKIVFWGVDEKDNDILVAMRLRTNDNRVDLWAFPKDKHSPAFFDKMFQNWNDINPDEFEQPFTHIEQSMWQPTLLPDSIRTTNADIIARTEKEWYIIILSIKLTEQIESEINELQAQIDATNEYDSKLWDQTVAFWNRVGQHFQARDLNRDQSGLLRDKINLIFDRLKLLRRTDNREFEAESQKNVQQILDSIAEQLVFLEEGRREPNEVFDNLKRIQEDTKDTRLTRDRRTEVRDSLNQAFEAVRTERQNSKNKRIDLRIKGLKEAIDKMTKSMNFDQKELEFQETRIANTNGKLETQLREAQIQMLQSKIESKREKIGDMLKTYNDLLLKTNEQSTTIKQQEEQQKDTPTTETSELDKTESLFDLADENRVGEEV